jgi:hypothetical protein
MLALGRGSLVTAGAGARSIQLKYSMTGERLRKGSLWCCAQLGSRDRSSSGSFAMLAAMRRAFVAGQQLSRTASGLVRAREASRDPGQGDADNQRCDGRRRGQQEKFLGKHPTQPNFPITHLG